MKQAKLFSAAALCFGIGSLAYCLGRSYGAAVAMGGNAFLFGALAYRARKNG